MVQLFRTVACLSFAITGVQALAAPQNQNPPKKTITFGVTSETTTTTTNPKGKTEKEGPAFYSAGESALFGGDGSTYFGHPKYQGHGRGRDDDGNNNDDAPPPTFSTTHKP
jgi:hypothetical protein